MKFDKSNVADLKQVLCNSNIHDSLVECMEYKWEEKTLLIKTVNKIWREKITFVFSDVRYFLIVIKNELGNRKAINSLTIEDKNIINECGDTFRLWDSESLYLLFQMFSDDEIHIISKDVHISVENIDVATKECETINYGKNILF